MYQYLTPQLMSLQVICSGEPLAADGTLYTLGGAVSQLLHAGSRGRHAETELGQRGNGIGGESGRTVGPKGWIGELMFIFEGEGNGVVMKISWCGVGGVVCV